MVMRVFFLFLFSFASDFVVEFVILGFACLYLDRISAAWLRLASPDLTYQMLGLQGCAILHPALLIELIFIYGEV